MKCRFCAAPLHYVFLDLGTAPPSNAFLRAGDLEKAFARSAELGEVLADLHREMLRVSLSRLNAGGREPSR